MIDLTYAVTPFVTWALTGLVKLVVNSCREGRWALNQMGFGGMPSNHSAIVGSMAALVALREGVDSPCFGVAITLAFIVVIDASSLRRQIGKQALMINQLTRHVEMQSLLVRERMGHSWLEIAAGLVTGVVIAWGINACT